MDIFGWFVVSKSIFEFEKTELVHMNYFLLQFALSINYSFDIDVLIHA